MSVPSIDRLYVASLAAELALPLTEATGQLGAEPSAEGTLGGAARLEQRPSQ